MGSLFDLLLCDGWREMVSARIGHDTGTLRACQRRRRTTCGLTVTDKAVDGSQIALLYQAIDAVLPRGSRFGTAEEVNDGGYRIANRPPHPLVKQKREGCVSSS